MPRSWGRNEPSRQPEYRAAYNEYHKLHHDRIANQDGCITWLLNAVRVLQKRVVQLEKHNDDLAAAALRLAHSNAEEFREPADDLHQRLRAQP
jgi:hypothetical protein